MKLKAVSCAVLSTLALVACGGSGSSSNNGGGSNPTNPGGGASSGLVSSCSGTNCGNVDEKTFGTGVGVWHTTNTTDAEKTVTVELTLNSDATVYGVYTNLDLSTDANFPAGVTRDVKAQSVKSESVKNIHERLHEKNREVLKSLKFGPSDKAQAQAFETKHNAVVGDQKNFYHEENGNTVSTSATLAYQATASDGRIINYWVQTSEYDPTKVSLSLVTQLNNVFTNGANSVYSTVVSIAGKPWGTTPFNNLISANQDLNVFISNLTPDNRAFGLMGYFWGGDTLLKTSNAQSNESLMVHIDSETLYKATYGVAEISSTLAHEFTHMVNFYQRDIVKYDSAQDKYFGFDTAMEETSALMMEDIVANQVQAFPEDRLLGWLNTRQLNCSLSEFTDNGACDSYSLHSSFGSLMLRKYGIAGYKQMLQDTSSITFAGQFDKMIQTQTGGDWDLGDELRNFAVSYVLLQRDNVPAMFGYGAKNDSGYQLKNLQSATSPYYSQYADGASATLPTTLYKAGGTYSTTYGVNTGKFTRQVTIPAHTSYSVVVVQKP